MSCAPIGKGSIRSKVKSKKARRRFLLLPFAFLLLPFRDSHPVRHFLRLRATLRVVRIRCDVSTRGVAQARCLRYPCCAVARDQPPSRRLSGTAPYPSWPAWWRLPGQYSHVEKQFYSPGAVTPTRFPGTIICETVHKCTYPALINSR